MSDVVLLQPGYAHYRNTLFSQLARRLRVTILYANALNEYPGLVAPSGFDNRFPRSRTGIGILDLLLEIRSLRPKVVITSVSSSNHTIVGWMYARLAGIPFVLWIEEWIQPTRQGAGFFLYQLRKLRRRLGNLIMRSADAVIASGTAAKQFALRIGTDPEKLLFTIQSSEDLMTHRRRAVGRPQGSIFRIVFLGRHIPSKGLDILLQAFANLQRRHSNIDLVIGGIGPCTEEWRTLARQLNLRNVTFHGPVLPSDVAEFLQQASVFVLPSCVRGNVGEPWGLVVNEAMSLGLPIVVSSAVGAGYDLVENGVNGFVFSEGNSDALALILEKLLNSDLSEFGKASRRIFEAKNSVEQMSLVFFSAVEMASRRRG